MVYSSPQVVSITTATNYAMKEVIKTFRTNADIHTLLFRDVLFVQIGTDDLGGNRGAFVFPYGVVVMWGLSEKEQTQFLETVRPYEENHYEFCEKESVSYTYGKKTEIVGDTITLDSSHINIQLTLSHGLAQSIKLSFFEGIIKKTINTTKVLPEHLSRYGKIPLSRKEIRKKMGEMFLERSFVNLHLDVLDTPEYFWDHSELEPFYRQIANHLELSPRLEVMNKRLDIVHDLFEMLGNELNHQHSNQLEWAIILLIVIEVVLTLLRDFANR
jgi:uncharacterized Rmd1/YagE family protein